VNIDLTGFNLDSLDPDEWEVVSQYGDSLRLRSRSTGGERYLSRPPTRSDPRALYPITRDELAEARRLGTIPDDGEYEQWRPQLRA
jgi:hypothetical protein